MTSTDPVDTAWRIHSAVVDWTGKVDTKASFALTIEAALLAGVVTLSGGGRALSDLHCVGLFLYIVGLTCLIGAVLCAAWVVRPRLRSASISDESATNFIYFGHLKQLTAEKVQDKLVNAELLPVLSRQLVEMSKIAWTKHRLVQFSLTLAPVGVALLGLSAIPW